MSCVLTILNMFSKMFIVREMHKFAQSNGEFQLVTRPYNFWDLVRKEVLCHHPKQPDYFTVC